MADDNLRPPSAKDGGATARRREQKRSLWVAVIMFIRNSRDGATDLSYSRPRFDRAKSAMRHSSKGIQKCGTQD
ncbi:hypothetical protein GCM10007887_42590 [Methylobacterium haplocladii]|uniref:Uncharacterized protein n=1 Tax=Methylobacterium haplocladii TaxID=1176176 RepID=A0A512IW38_9HYPH|nr:hypothetical protein MHA02_42920 [Methylobacterium haplocladii]GLS61538.1 hypothetical protein GCM10007887_42590 [Methylobacterium haplocladii]